MRSMWKGAVSFGLVSIPVKMYSATEERDVSFHQVRRSDGSRVRYRRVAEADGAEVAYSDIAKGYTLDSGETVILTDDDFAELPLPTTHALDVLQFVPLEQVDPIYFNKSYYLEPEKSASKPYVLLREALQRSGMVAVVKVAIRTREQLATMRVRDDVIVLETMLWPDEIRTPDFAFLDEDISLREPELAMADALVASMSGEFQPEEFSDDYRDALMQVIEAKATGVAMVETPDATSSSGGNVVDLMAALRASVDAAKQRRGETVSGDGSADAPAAKAPALKAASKTASTKAADKTTTPAKAAATKTAATKTAAAKATAAGKTAAAKTGVKMMTAAKTTAAKTAPIKTTAAKAAPTAKAPTRRAPAKETVAARKSA